MKLVYKAPSPKHTILNGYIGTEPGESVFDAVSAYGTRDFGLSANAVIKDFKENHLTLDKIYLVKVYCDDDTGTIQRIYAQHINK